MPKEPDWKVQRAINNYNAAVDQRDDAEIIANKTPSEENEVRYQEAYMRWERAYKTLVAVRGF